MLRWCDSHTQHSFWLLLTTSADPLTPNSQNALVLPNDILPGPGFSRKVTSLLERCSSVTEWLIVLYLVRHCHSAEERFVSAHAWSYTRNSWIKTDQLDVTRFFISPFTAQHVSNVSTSIFRSLRLNVDLFHVLYFSGSMCVVVTVVSLCRLKHSVLQLA